MKETCRICKEIKERIMHKIYKDGSTVFVDDNGKRWWGLACPGCIKVLRKKYDPYIPLDPNLECKLCGVHYTRKGSNSKYCSIECSKKAIARKKKMFMRRRRQELKKAKKENNGN